MLGKILKRLGTLMLASALLIPAGSYRASADGAGTATIPVDSVNGTRWADLTVVYKDRPTTLQNEWGWNVVVSAEGVVTDKIDAGDIRGKNLAVPEGGFILSGTGEVTMGTYETAKIGDNAYFDEYGMRVLISGDTINPFYETVFRFTGYNEVRYANKLVIYNRPGTNTGTNGYGYEVRVGSDGYILSAGGNDSVVPDGGYVISAIEAEDINTLRTYCVPGARCSIEGSSVRVTYDASMLAATVANELALLKEEVITAGEQLRLVDYDAVNSRIAALNPSLATDLASRDELLGEIKELSRLLIERRTVEIRSVWYVPVESRASEVRETVAEMKAAGINQLCLGIINSGTSLLRVPGVSLFRIDTRAYRFDILQAYAEACREQGIELVASVPVFQGSDNGNCDGYLALTNRGEVNAEHFASPASDEYFTEISAYIKYIVLNYDIDGIQYDYIRYPYFDGTTDFGYDAETKALFAAETGLDAGVADEIAVQLRAHKNWQDWVGFKVSLIDRRVSELSSMIRSCRPDLYISAAVANDTAAELYCQDSSHWLESGDVDGIYPMSYAAGIFRDATGKFRQYITDSSFLVMGSGAYLSLTADEMFLQLGQQAEYGGDGIAFFEWSSYVNHGYAAAFAETVFSAPALSFTRSASESIEALKKTAVDRFELFCRLSGEESGALNSEMTLEEMNSVLAAYGNEYLSQDIELALRIREMSESRPENTGAPGDGTSSEDESPDSGSAEESETASEGSGAGKTRSIIPWAVGAVAAAACAAVIVVILRKRKKR